MGGVRPWSSAVGRWAKATETRPTALFVIPFSPTPPPHPGGLIFGWNALALMLKAQGAYADSCPAPALPSASCAARDTRLAVVWTVGAFALNSGPVAVGPVLDWLGPKLTTALGVCLNAAALLLLAFGGATLPGALPASAVLLGLGGITFHLAQMHVFNLFPTRRGLISSLLVAGFTGCGIVFYLLEAIWSAAAGGAAAAAAGDVAAPAAFRTILAAYAGVCALWIPLAFWMQPWHALRVGQAHVWTGAGKFSVVARRDYAHRRPTVATATTATPGDISLASLPPGAKPPAVTATRAPSSPGASPLAVSPGPLSGEAALAYMGLRPLGAGGVADSADPRWAELDSGGSDPRRPSDGGGAPLAAPSPSSRPAAPAAPSESYGKLTFEARRFVELREKPFWAQFRSAESTGMGAFYTLNVLFLQFYLGTTRLQLESKGDAGTGWTYTKIASIVPAFGFVGIPCIGWLLDHRGYGATLATINALAVAASLAQAIPSLPFQVVTLLLWTYGRFFLYTSYYSIFGALFGFRNFGRMVAIDNCVNGVVGLLQLPLTSWGLHGLHGNFTAINLLQAGLLLPLFWFCWAMRSWETADLVPIRPAEGETLPVNLLGPRVERQAKFLGTLEKRLAGLVGG